MHLRSEMVRPCLTNFLCHSGDAEQVLFTVHAVLALHEKKTLRCVSLGETMLSDCRGNAGTSPVVMLWENKLQLAGLEACLKAVSRAEGSLVRVECDAKVGKAGYFEDQTEEFLRIVHYAKSFFVIPLFKKYGIHIFTHFRYGNAWKPGDAMIFSSNVTMDECRRKNQGREMWAWNDGGQETV